MDKKEKVFLTAISAIMTAVAAYLLVKICASDIVLSIIPGWYTTILSPETPTFLLTGLLLISGMIVNMLFHTNLRLLSMLWMRMKKQ